MGLQRGSDQQVGVDLDPATITVGTLGGKRLKEPLPDPLSSHLDEAEFGDIEHLGAGLVPGECFAEYLDHIVSVVLDLHIDSLVFDLQKAIASTKENKNRVKATVDAYFGFIDAEGGAFRLLFESDMSVEPQVRERLNRMTYDCAVAVSAVISLDTGFPKEESMMLAIGLIGCAQITARHWLEKEGKIDRKKAAALVTNLLWRGISGFPLQN